MSEDRMSWTSVEIERAVTCNNDDSTEYDEALVYVEFTGLGVIDILNQKNPELKVIGLLENDPKIQLGGQVYAGKLDDTLGTHLFFEPTPTPPEDFDHELNIKPEQWFRYDCKTKKELIARRVYTTKKSSGDEAETTKTSSSSKIDKSDNNSVEVIPEDNSDFPTTSK